MADGASQSTWSARGARHAAGAFIETFDEFALLPLRGEKDLAEEGSWALSVAETLHGALRRRLYGDYSYLLKNGFVDPSWDEQLYRERFTSPANDKHLDSWFQTTLLAAAIGPSGGFAVFLGDGYYRVDRTHGPRVERFDDHPNSVPVNLRLLRKHIEVVRIPPRGAARLGVIVATDGVSKSGDEALRKAMLTAGVALRAETGGSQLSLLAPTSSMACTTFLEKLSQQPGADQDNMSLAFASRELASDT